MAKMILGGYTFTHNPEISFPVIKPKKETSYVKTYSSVAYFSWTPSIVGETVLLEWEWMEAAQFDSLNTLYQADATIVFNPNTTPTYNVVILNLDGVYWINMATANYYRKNVKLELLILSQN